MNKKGRFIVFEGGEGSGKSTALENLRKVFGDDQFIYTHEPGGTPAAELIREVFLTQGSRDEKFTALTQLFLIGAARTQHMETLIRPALEEGKHVVCDRFNLSTYAYQIARYKRYDLIDAMKVIDFLACGNGHLASNFLNEVFMGYVLSPDLYIFFDVDPEIGRERALKRKGKQSSFDKEKLETHQRVYEGFFEIISTIPSERVYQIDGQRSENEVLNEVVTAIKKIIWSQ